MSDRAILIFSQSLYRIICYLNIIKDIIERLGGPTYSNVFIIGVKIVMKRFESILMHKIYF